MTKYILVSGGVVSGIGKGVIGALLLSRDGVLNNYAASSTGLLLKTLGLKVTAIKIDPYMNIDAGTMRPTEHGEFAWSKRSSQVGRLNITSRRGVRPQRRGGGRSRSRKLRAVPQRDTLEG